MLSKFLIALACVALLLSPAQAEAKPLRLYLDADFSVDAEASEAIELGVRTALAEAGGRIGGYPVELSRRDHRRNSKRSRLNMERFLRDPHALAMIGGKQSPPYLTYKSFINSNELPLLLPWSAAGPVTRAAAGEANWIFRLSIDDAKAGPFLIRRAVGQGCARVALALLDTGWGRSNRRTMTRALAALGREPAATIMFSSVLGPNGAAALARDVAAASADCVILVASPVEGAEIVNALHAERLALRIFSHWGILGGRFPKKAPHDRRAALKLQMIQTCGLTVEERGSKTLRRALARAGAPSLRDMPASAGFVHGYDLTRILTAAADQASQTEEWAGTIREKRRALKRALENLQAPVQGILDRYEAPFAPYSAEAPDAHEALSARHLCMAAFGADDRLTNAHALPIDGVSSIREAAR